MTDFNSLMEEEAKAASDVWNLAKKIGVGFVGSMAGGLAAATSGTAVMAGQALTGKPVDPNVIPVMQQAVQQKVVGDLLGQSAAEAPSSAAGKLVAEGATVVGEANQKAFADAATRTGRYWEGVSGSTTVGGVAAAIPQIALDAVDMLGRGVIPTGRGTGPTRNIYGGVQTAAENDPQVAATLDKAIQMEREGVPMLDIFNQTNAFKSRIDGMWRLWVSDEGASLNIKQAIKGKSFAQMADRGVENKVLLGSLLKHDKMFEMYPELRTLPVKFEVRRGIHSDQGVNSPYGIYEPNKDEITLFVDPDNPTSVAPERLLNTLVHEANHAIQRREGFVDGSNADFVLDVLTKHVRPLKNPMQEAIAARKMGDDDAEEAAHIARDMMNPDKVYQYNVGEIDSHFAGDLAGKKDGNPLAAFLIGHSASGDILKNTLGTDPVKNIKDFIDAFPLVWGNRRVLEYFIDDPKLIKEYEDKYVQQATEHRKAWEGKRSGM